MWFDAHTRSCVANDEVVAQHERYSDRGQTHYYMPLVQLKLGAPFADPPPASQQLRKGLLHQAGGERVMAQVLAIVSTAGLHAVLVTVELAQESAAITRGRQASAHAGRAWLH